VWAVRAAAIESLLPHARYVRAANLQSGLCESQLGVTLTGLRIALIAGSLAVMSIIADPKVAETRDALLAIAGEKLHIETAGTSGPPVVFEAGLGNDSTTWKSIAGPISGFARVVLYDRPGLGQSSPFKDKNAAVSADEVVAKLHALLTAADIRPPYILAGHSLGGLYMQMFARKYPKDVSGVVLLESSSPDAPIELKTRAFPGNG